VTMQIYETRQKVVDGKPIGWHMVCSNSSGSRVYPVGYCADHAPHPTAEDAERCYRAWTLDTARFSIESPDEMRRCGVCGDWTLMRAEVGGSFPVLVPLCPTHQDRASLDAATSKPTT